LHIDLHEPLVAAIDGVVAELLPNLVRAEDAEVPHFPKEAGSGVEVADKQRNKNYYSANGMQISSDDPKNPYGGFWIDLGQDVSIHGSPELNNGGTNPGCISLSPLDASDVFGMLGRGSQVTIRQ
jgi:hypothetical protein